MDAVMIEQLVEKAALKYVEDHPEVIEQIVQKLVEFAVGKLTSALQKPA